MASYSATKKNKPINAGLAVGAFDSFNTDHVVGDFNPNEEIFRADNTWDWDAKLLASYNFPGDVLLSANFHHQSGEAYARQVRFEGGVTIPSITLNVEEIGTHRLPSVNLLTFRFEKAFRLQRNAEAGAPPRSAQRVEREHGDRKHAALGSRFPAAPGHHRAAPGGDQRDVHLLTRLLTA